MTKNQTPNTKRPAEVGGIPQRPSVCIHTLQPRGIPSTGATVSFKTIGCRLNQAETDQIEAQFESAGYRTVTPGTECDVAVINTCTITHGAERDSARWARRLRRQGAKTVIMVGCAIEHNGENLQKQTGADIIANQSQKLHLLELLESHKLQAQVRGVPRRPSWCSEAEAAPAKRDTPNRNTSHPRAGEAIRGTTSKNQEPKERPTSNEELPNPQNPAPRTSPKTRALVKAQDGCNFRCSYCIVPDARGLPYSLPLIDVINDIQQKADQGYREIVITGANIGCYNHNGNTLITLLEKAEEINGIERIRISSIESTTAERAVIEFMAKSSKLCHFLHLPLQSGDDQILKQMRRHYTASQYRETAEYAVATIPNLGLGTDIIVGFPGESDQAFQNTLSLVDKLPFTNLHVFSYSKRSGTPAAEMPNQIEAAVKKERSAALIALGKSKREAFAKSFIGKEVSALIEKIDNAGIASGWTEEYLPVKITTPQAKPNQIIKFTPTTTHNDILS